MPRAHRNDDPELEDAELIETVDDLAPARPNAGKVVVITGASSGIGHATALEFARDGYHVVLAARRKRELEDVAVACREHEVDALVQPADTTDEVAVQQLAAAAVKRFGTIDVWINNAGVSVYGDFLDTPTEDFRQVMDTNVMGYVHGAKAALRQFKAQGHGLLINISSINATAPLPYSTAYTASKYAIRGLTESLRMELEAEELLGPIQVCNVMPASTDTNFFQNAANYSHHEIQAVEPVYDPAYVGKAIVKLADQDEPQWEIAIGPAGKLMAAHHALSHRSYEKMFSKYGSANNFSRKLASNQTGNLYGSLEDNRGMRGGWRHRRLSATTVNMMLGAAAAGLVGLTVVATLAGRKHHRRHL